MGFTFCWRSWGKIEYLVIDIIVSLFIALAVEPVVVPLVKHGWKRSFASLFSLLMLAVMLGVLFTLFGNLFVQQMIALVNGLPDLYEQMCQFASQYANFQLPEINNLGNEILKNIQTSWVTDFAGTALNTVSGLFSFLINLMTIIMTTYYISAAGPKLRRAACQWMAPAAQRRFLFVWTVSQSQISSFLFSRAILALLNAFFTGICLMLLHVPYWLPLALFCGVVSQFIPMLGTYIGGALPVLFAWGSCGLWQAVAVLVFICVYQQIENLIFAPKISQRTMDVNDAVAFLAVLAFTSLFGALGAFLALPVVASVQTIFRTYTKRYELVDSPLMDDPVPEKKSKLVEGAEVLSEHLHNMPRAVQGSSAHVLFPTKCGSCRSRRTISPVPRNRWNRTKPSPSRSTCWTKRNASHCRVLRVKTHLRNPTKIRNPAMNGRTASRGKLKEVRKTRMTIQEVGGVNGTAERT